LGVVLVWFIQEGRDIVIIGNVLDVIKFLPKNSFNAIVTSPPYYKRKKYNVITEFPDGWVGELGWEPSVELFAEHLAIIFEKLSKKMCECCPILVNIDDTKIRSRFQSFGKFSGKYIDVSGEIIRKFEEYGLCLNHKFILLKGYYDTRINKKVRVDPRFLARHSFEYMLLFSKSKDCFFDKENISDVVPIFYDYVTNRNEHESRNTVSHFEYFIREFTSKGDTVLDPFGGTGTTGIIAKNLGRHFIIIEARPYYIDATNLFKP